MTRYVLNTLGSFRSALAVGVGLPFLVAASAHAQAPKPAPAEATTERVIVTGSYIPTAETESALPVTVYTAEVLQKQGANTPVEGLRQLPSFIGAASTENDSNGGNGQAGINLRGLGQENTLILINGRRTFNFNDVNAIPIGGLSRTEILKDGASAVYGSDAVAGVVNFIMLNGPGEKPYEGAEIFARYDNTTDTDAHVRQAFVRGGVTGLDGKVSIAASGEYYSRANLYSRDRGIDATADLTQNPGALGLGGINGNSPNYPGRVTIAGPVPQGGGNRTLIDQSNNAPVPASYRRFDAAGVSTDPDRFNFRLYTPAIPALEKAMYYITGRYKVFGDALQLYGDIMYTKSKQDNGLAPSPFGTANSGSYFNTAVFVPFLDPRTGQAFGNLPGPGTTVAEQAAAAKLTIAAQLSILQNSPFNPFPGRQRFTPNPNQPLGGSYTNPVGSLAQFAYRTVQESGNRRSFYDRDYYRYVAGAEGNFTFKDNGFISRFGYDTGFVYERFEQELTDSGDLTRSGLYREIINAATIPGYVGFDPFIGERALTHGFAPIYNAAGVQTGTQEYDNLAAAQRAAYLGHSFDYERDWLVDAKTNMHLFPNLWNGGVDLAVGYEHRESAIHHVADPVQANNDQLGFNQDTNTKFLQKVNSVFTELNIPFVTSTMNVPFVRSLEMDLAWRYEKFDDMDQYFKTTASFDNPNQDEDFGGTPRVSLRYQPIADLTLRASWGQSFLSPSPTQLFQPPTQNFPVIIDQLNSSSYQPNGGVFQSGNSALTPEKTEAYTAGMVWTPKFLPGFTMTADWYQVYTKDLILGAASSAQVIATLNSQSGGTAFTTSGCNNGVSGLMRDPDTNLITCINAGPINAAKRLVQGIDVTAVYEIPTDRFGKFTLSGGYNHFFTWKAEPQPGPNQDVSFLGNYTVSLPLSPGAIPWNKAFLRGEWQWRHFDFISTGNYIGDYRDDPAPALRTTFDGVRTIPSYITLDMQLSYEFVKPAAEPAPTVKDAKDGKNVMQTAAETSTIWQRMLWGTTLTVGVNDAFDRQPPTSLASSSGPSVNDNYDTSTYSIRNRYYYVSLNKKF